MLLSIKIIKEMEKEIKTLKDFLKILERQEEQYQVDYTLQKEQIHSSINYYYKVIKESK